MTETNKPQSPSEAILATRRNFLRKAGMGVGAVAGATLSAPYVNAQSAPIKWRLQTYSGAPLGAHVIKPQIEAFNAAANGEMEIELYYADQLVPTADLFRALQNGTLDAGLVMDLLRKLAAEQEACIVTVTHDEKIFDRFDRLIHLRDGRLADA